VLAGWAFVAIGVILILISGCSNRPSPPPVAHQVDIKGMQFKPKFIEVAPGDTVRWTNRDLVPHTATAKTGTFDSGDLPPDSSWVTVVIQDGVLDYSCRYHPEMKGSILANSQ
jgi:plastocyanin